jgi:hypothetical protein
MTRTHIIGAHPRAAFVAITMRRMMMRCPGANA